MNLTPNTAFNPKPFAISDDAVERYQTDGVLLLRAPFVDWVDTLGEGVAQNMAAPSEFERTYRPADGSPPFFQDYCNWNRFPEYRQFVFDSPAGQIAARLMQSGCARFFHEHVLVKEPGTSIPTPWHQDQPYYCVEGQQRSACGLRWTR